MSREAPTSKDDVKTLLNKVCDHTTKEMIARCSAVIISQPFHVIALRTMAQFIGQETIYCNMYLSTVEIYKEDGILGFFAGLAPRLVAEIITIWLSNLLAYALNTYVLTESSDLKDLRQYSQMAMSYVAQTVTYPLSVTSTVMAVNGARIQGGRPPFMVIYGGWYSCLKDLHKQGQTSRGSSMWFRKAVAHAVAATSVSPMPPPPITYKS
uniref:Mitochondrial carrier homolog 2 n=1 Tax=Phallusia mammillata TaxID=59560 RepID=A0A6F9DLI0_9ASCI|nr:mitochondrial carrier homolog 2 [Phallusia mammillata]